MRLVWTVALIAAPACSNGSAGSAAEDGAGAAASGQELIPAEWTVSEDTSTTGEVTTTSLQLPAAKDIAGLLEDQSPRLVLRCLEGRVAAFIATDPVDGASHLDASVSMDPARIELDAAPPCE